MNKKDSDFSYEDEESQEISKYNEASLQIMRLHELWLQAESYAKRGILIKWKFLLDSIWRELISDILKHPDKTKLLKKDNELKEKIANAKNRTALYLALDARHQELKLIQDDVGKGSIYAEPDNDSFE